MDLFEYQGKSLFARSGVPVPPGIVARTPAEARSAAEELGGRVVVKAQVQVGGRGKAGGIKLAADAEEAERHAGEILGMDIKGHTVHIVLIELASEIAADGHGASTLDRGAHRHSALVSATGGMDLEAVAAEDPAAVVTLPIDPDIGLTEGQARELVYRAGLDRAAARASASVLLRLYRAFVDLDCDLVEVNPMILTGAGEVVALDSKVSLDSNGFFRHKDFEDVRADFAEDPMDKMARERGLNFS